ncbi:HCP-like protein [Gigaspora margarita]|uniref:HCP-like protein n=1 Tax=Gigaspora margarita TaxID=4874 RepID=A0A8H4ALQ5_GIGMA|nr:HCP-like protein [Gigaspora margarita]
MNDAIEIYNVENCYRNGIGTEKNEQEAFSYYHKSANMENILVIYLVRICYKQKIRVEDDNKAFSYYLKSAEMRFHYGLNQVSSFYLYEYKNIVEKDKHKAYIYLKQDHNF